MPTSFIYYNQGALQGLAMMSKTIAKITPCKIKPWKKTSPRFSPRGHEDETLDLPSLNLRRNSHWSPMDRRMDTKKIWKRNWSSYELLEALRYKTELGGFDLEDWSLLFLLMHPQELGFKTLKQPCAPVLHLL